VEINIFMSAVSQFLYLFEVFHIHGFPQLTRPGLSVPYLSLEPLLKQRSVRLFLLFYYKEADSARKELSEAQVYTGCRSRPPRRWGSVRSVVFDIHELQHQLMGVEYYG
jgi:hypothetical protein